MDEKRQVEKRAESKMKDRHMRSFRESRERLPRHYSVQEKRANARRLAKQRQDEMDY